MIKADNDTTVDSLQDIFRLIREDEIIPEGLEFPKKGNLTNCGNKRAIALMLR